MAIYFINIIKSARTRFFKCTFKIFHNQNRQIDRGMSHLKTEEKSVKFFPLLSVHSACSKSIKTPAASPYHATSTFLQLFVFSGFQTHSLSPEILCVVKPSQILKDNLQWT